MSNLTLKQAIEEHFGRLEKLRREVLEAETDRKNFSARFPDIVVGATVTIKEGELDGYGSRYVEIESFKPGMTGIVGAVTVAKISGPRNPPPSWLPFFVCIDYLDSNDQLQRCAAEYTNIEVLHER